MNSWSLLGRWGRGRRRWWRWRWWILCSSWLSFRRWRGTGRRGMSRTTVLVPSVTLLKELFDSSSFKILWQSFFLRFAQLIMPNKPPRMAVTWKSRNSVRNWKQGSGMSLCPARRRWRSWSRWWGAASGREKHLALNFYSHMLCAWWSLYPKQTTVPAQRRCHWSLREKKNVSVCQMFCLHAKFEW